MSVTGVVTSVSPTRSGDSLSADTAATDEVLLIDDAGDFDEVFEVPRFLVFGEETTPREYVAVENDEEAQQSVTLAAPVGAVYEAGTPVTLWDPESEAADKRAVAYRAWVRLEDGTSFPATIPHGLVPLGAEYTLDGAQVGVDEDDDGDWYVERVYGREAVVNQGAIEIPFTTLYQASAISIPHDVYTRLTGWTVSGNENSSLSSGWVTLARDGLYLFQAAVNWTGNSSGRRYVQFVTRLDGVTSTLRTIREAPADSLNFTQQISVTERCAAGMEVSLEARQTSGAALDVNGSADGRLTAVQVVRVQA